MAKLGLTVATWDYDRVRALMDGRVQVEGCDINFIKVPPEECFHRAWNHQEFDVTEIGLSGYIIGVSRGSGAFGVSPYVAIPVFVSRSFRCSSIYTRTDRGIDAPRDLRGAKIGVPEYQITAAVWARGYLSDEYGVKVEDVRWFQGGMDNPGRKDKWPNNLPQGFPLSFLQGDQTLNRLFMDGELDALICPRTPASYRDGKTPVRRLFENFEEVEKEYYRKSKVFPIMHAIGIRRDVYEKHPWVAANLYKAFCEAKRISQADLFETAALKIGLPWVVSSAQSAQQVLGSDIFPYGVESSRTTLETAIRYSVEQHIAVRRVSTEELFPASTMMEPKT
ncbi:MAG: ABC transporter substrate-binding protein [Burkholderiales bacterium]|nr:ABC transporter substrate-binding protein [Burkholderiales bacterium]